LDHSLVLTDVYFIMLYNIKEYFYDLIVRIEPVNLGTKRMRIQFADLLDGTFDSKKITIIYKIFLQVIYHK
jgi:hypothetical protein